MSFLTTALKLHSHAQKLMALPYFVTDDLILAENVRYKAFLQKYLRFSTSLCILVYAIFLACRMIWMSLNWDTYTIQHLDQAVFHSLAMSCMALALISFGTIYLHHNSFIYGINQIKLGLQGKTSGWLWDTIGKSAGYQFGIVGVALPLSFFTLPFAISFDPIQFAFGTELYVTVSASLLYGLPLSFGSFAVVSVISLLVGYTEGLIILTADLKQSLRIIPNPNSQKYLMLRFRTFYSNLSAIRILCAIFDEIGSRFLSALIFFGVLFATCSSYATLKMYRWLPLHVYVCMPLCAVTCFVVAIVHNAMEGYLQNNCKVFQSFWLKQLFRKEVRKLIRSIRTISCTIACYGVSNHILGLKICDDIVQNLISLLLACKF